MADIYSILADIYSILGFIFGFTFLIAFIATMVGLIRPSLVIRWGENRTRWRVLLYYGLGSCVVIFLVSALSAVMPEEVKIKREQARLESLEMGKRLLSAARTAYDSQDFQTAIDSANKSISVLKEARSSLANQAQVFLDSAEAALDEQREEAKYTTEFGTLDRLVEKHVHHVFGETVRRDGKNVPTVLSISTGYTAKIAYREGTVVTTGLALNSLILDTMEFMKRVFTDPACGEIQIVLLRPHNILINKYGQSSEDQIGKIVLSRKVFEKINWSYMTTDRFEQLLKGEGEFRIHNAFK